MATSSAKFFDAWGSFAPFSTKFSVGNGPWGKRGKETHDSEDWEEVEVSMWPSSTDVIRCHKTTKKLVVYFKEMLCSTGKSRVVKILILIYPDKSNLLFDVWKGAKELGKYLLIYHQILQKIVEAQWQLFKKEDSTQE